VTTPAVRCSRVGKSYVPTSALGVKEWFVGRRWESDRFSRRWALSEVSFDVTPGDGFAIVGANGSGKSTLLGVLLGVLRPDRGSVETRGRVASLLELGAGFHPELTGRQNLYLHGAILGMRLREVRERFDAIVAFSELGRAIDAPLRTYSSGMIARLGFSAIAHAAADILLIDEVLAVGDLEFQEKCRGFLAAFRAGGGTLILVSHDLAAVEAMCEHGIWLDQGTVRAEGPIGQVIEVYRQASHVASAASGERT
jgi:ABC-type polysaccharide/polyol phosphate transport system ATPase subunit